MMENNNVLMIKGKTKVCGVDIPNIYGGFSDNQKVMLAKTVAIIHDKQLKHVNELINKNLNNGYFKFGIDYIDLKKSVGSNDSLLELGFNKQSIANSKNIYLLSQQGYTTLLKLLDSELAMKQYKIVVRDYFKLKGSQESIIYLTQKELEQLVVRKDGTIRRNRETSSISTFIQNGELPNNRSTYASLTNLTYDILFGMYAKEIKEYLDLKQQDNLRDFLSTQDLSIIREVEDEIHWMCKQGYTWREIYRDLVKEYPNKVEPVRAEKSIKELKKAKRIAIDESVIKKLR